MPKAEIQDSKPISNEAWIDLSNKAYKRLQDVLDYADEDDQKLIQAIKETFDRAYGRPTERTELTGKDGGPVQITGFEFVKNKK